MMRRTAKLLLDARDAALEIESFTAGRTVDAMHTDRALQLSVHRLLEIVGGALDRIQATDPEAASTIPDLRRFVQLRDQLMHCDPDTEDHERIWRVATQMIPSLRVMLDDQLRQPSVNINGQHRSAQASKDHVIALVSGSTGAIANLCREFGIKKLDVFGSAATGAFNPETSDIDFIVDFGEYDRGTAWRYFDFADALEELLGQQVELITEEEIKNPYFRAMVEEQRVNVYNGPDDQAAA